MLKFLIDECISPDVAGLAGDFDLLAFHVNWLGMQGWRDQLIAVYCVAEDMVLVTNNAVDFKPIYRSLDVHPGLVVVLPSVPRSEQLRLMEIVFARLKKERDLINKLIEINAEGKLMVNDFPPFQDNF